MSLTPLPIKKNFRGGGYAPVNPEHQAIFQHCAEGMISINEVYMPKLEPVIQAHGFTLEVIKEDV